MERLKDKRKSTVLLSMAESIGSVAECIGSSQRVNEVNADWIRAVKNGSSTEGRKKRRRWSERNCEWTKSIAITGSILGLILGFVLHLIAVSRPVPETPQQRALSQLKNCVGGAVWENMTELIVPSNRCNNEGIDFLDLSMLSRLKSIEIGDDCFEKVKEVKLIGLSDLERVVIGQNSFTEHKDNAGKDSTRHFYLKNCEKVRELKMGRYSFSDYSLIEIENVPSLEVIEMGELNEDSYNFCHASLELKSDSERMD